MTIRLSQPECCSSQCGVCTACGLFEQGAANMGITRRDFGTGMGGFVMLTIVGCGGYGDDNEGDFLIGGNHTTGGAHSIFVPSSDFAADINSQQAKSYDIAGQARHNHIVVFSAAQMQTLK